MVEKFLGRKKSVEKSRRLKVTEKKYKNWEKQEGQKEKMNDKRKRNKKKAD